MFAFDVFVLLFICIFICASYNICIWSQMQRGPWTLEWARWEIIRPGPTSWSLLLSNDLIQSYIYIAIDILLSLTFYQSSCLHDKFSFPVNCHNSGRKNLDSGNRLNQSKKLANKWSKNQCSFELHFSEGLASLKCRVYMLWIKDLRSIQWPFICRGQDSN